MRDFLRRWFGPNRDAAHVGRTYSDRLLLKAVAVVVIGLGVGAVGVLLLSGDNWAEVLAGAFIAWSAAAIAWGIEMYRHPREDVRKELRHMAEMDVIHARLNQIANTVGAPLLGLQGQIEHVTNFRERRLAHFANLDEFTAEPHGTEDGIAFWDLVAQGGEM
jgi:hypothetical protein